MNQYEIASVRRGSSRVATETYCTKGLRVLAGEASGPLRRCVQRNSHAQSALRRMMLLAAVPDPLAAERCSLQLGW